MLAVGLAIAGATLELFAIPFILPSAEIELCILPHEKNWLGEYLTDLPSLFEVTCTYLLGNILQCNRGALSRTL